MFGGGSVFKDDKMKIVVSIILGLGLASLFKRVCEGRNCIILKEGIDKNNIERNTYKFKDNCYKFKSKKINC